MNTTTIKNLINFHLGYWYFKRKGRTPNRSFKALRNLYVSTRGAFVEKLSQRLAKKNPPLSVAGRSSVLGDDYEALVSDAVAGIQKDGYYRFPVKLSPEFVTRLREYAEQEPCRALIEDTKETTKAKFEYAAQKESYRGSTTDTPKFNFEMGDLVKNPDIQELLTDPAFVALAQNYLGCEPVLDLLAMWWSKPFHGKASSGAAQLYHFDMDRIRFFKIFFYLTDVTPETGPHCYVRGSHRTKPPELWRDGRISDEDMAAGYDEADLVEICGEAGTILAVDTIGFHKGKALTEGERLLLQFEFSNSLFGANYPRPRIEASSRLGQAAKEFPRRYGIFAAE